MAIAGKIAVLLGLGAVIFGGVDLWRTVNVVQVPAPPSGGGKTPITDPNDTAANPQTRPWPAMFGVPDQAAPAVAAPATVNEDYQLVGLIAGQQIRWAIVAFSGGEVLVRVGDVLAGGETVEDITTQGVWIRQGQKRSRIGFSSEDAATMIGENGASARVGKLDQSVRVARSTFAGRDLRRVFGRAGTIQMVPGSGAALTPEILWVRPDEIFDKIGLKQGDKVLRINGKPAGDPETLRQGDALLASEPEVRLDILRGGVIGTITVLLVENG